MTHAKRFIVLAGLCTFTAGPAGAQAGGASGDQTATRNAYADAMRCFVANGHARGLRERAGDTEKAAIYEAHARESWEAAYKLGHELALPNDRIEQDFSLAQTTELPPMVTDQQYFFSAVAKCKALGLM